jgi:iron-chelate-transporting ATPase
MTDSDTQAQRSALRTPAEPYRTVVTQGGGGEALYTLDGTSFVIENRTVLHPLTLNLSKGCFYGLIGHNGSGKSTLIKLLARQQPPTAGSIHLLGEPIDGWSQRTLARKIAYLPQQLPPAQGMTVRELVALGRYPWHGALGRFSAQDTAKVDEALELTDTTGFADRRVDSLSGGERQRVWIAMLVAQDSDCLLLDEPISALDIGHQIEVLELVHELCATRGLGVVAVLHDINMAARFCDHLIALKEGRLIMQGSPEQVMRDHVLEAIYGIPMGTIEHPHGGRRISFAY